MFNTILHIPHNKRDIPGIGEVVQDHQNKSFIPEQPLFKVISKVTITDDCTADLVEKLNRFNIKAKLIDKINN